eukprot:771039-Amorphochlora_amoeboformis.AAC.2
MPLNVVRDVGGLICLTCFSRVVLKDLETLGYYLQLLIFSERARIIFETRTYVGMEDHGGTEKFRWSYWQNWSAIQGYVAEPLL